MEEEMGGLDCIHYLRWATLCTAHNFHCSWEGCQKHHWRLSKWLLQREELYVISITLIWALTWALNSASATCWGSFTWLVQLTKLLQRVVFVWKLTQMTSNGGIDDSCVHKCFSLGLSWLWPRHGAMPYTRFDTSGNPVQSELHLNFSHSLSAWCRKCYQVGVCLWLGWTRHCFLYLDAWFCRYHYSNTSINLNSECSKCFLLG